MTEKAAPPRHYWDSCVFLHYINEEPAYVDALEALLARSYNGEIEIVTSVVSIAEVAFAASEQKKKALDPEQLERIDKLWADTRTIKLIEFHELIAKSARELRRVGIPTGATGLRSIDAVHLATAKWMKVAECNTYERKPKWSRYAGEIGCEVREPSYTPPPPPPAPLTLFEL